jgi:biotin carboxyl carrier protein
MLCRPAVLVPAVLLVFMASCGGEAASTTAGPGAPDSAPPPLTAAFVAPEAALAFYVFGATLPSGVRNPTWEIETASPATPVMAAMSGKVVSIAATSQGDSTVVVIPSDQSVYAVIHDHVSAVRVTVGQNVTAGSQVGTTGRLGNGRGRTELQINRLLPAPTVAVCPRTFYTAAVNDQFQAAAQRVNGNASTCLSDTVVP